MNNSAKTGMVLDVINRIAKVKITKEQIQFKGDYLNLKCNPVLKNEIFMRKEEIESELRSFKIFLKIN